MIIDRKLALADTFIDLYAGVGQVTQSFRFTLMNGATNQQLGEIHPIRTATLTHDTTRTIKRQLRLALGVTDAADINPASDRVDVTMTVAGVDYPLGRYVFTDYPRQDFLNGQLAAAAMTDEMIIIDQQVTSGISGRNRLVNVVIQEVLAPFDYTKVIAATDGLFSIQNWGPGANRGQVLEALALTGDMFSPWFDNNRVLRFIRSFNPADSVPNFDFDAGNAVNRDSIVHTDDTLTAPNQYVVISNAGPGTAAVTGTANIPDSAPHSIANRGFAVPEVLDLQANDTAQAVAMAQSLAITQTVAERVSLVTALDPRHDSYDVVIWQGEKWLELGWAMDLEAGGGMSHTMRKVYS